MNGEESGIGCLRGDFRGSQCASGGIESGHIDALALAACARAEIDKAFAVVGGWLGRFDGQGDASGYSHEQEQGAKEWKVREHDRYDKENRCRNRLKILVWKALLSGSERRLTGQEL